jgi:hypothetical protein
MSGHTLARARRGERGKAADRPERQSLLDRCADGAAEVVDTPWAARMDYAR